MKNCTLANPWHLLLKFSLFASLTALISCDSLETVDPTTPSGGGGSQTVNQILGTDDSDRLRGTNGVDEICGFGGNDDIMVRGDDDWADGGPGDDELTGGPGDDELRGSGGDDRISAGRGNDMIVPGMGDDYVDGGSGTKDRVFLSGLIANFDGINSNTREIEDTVGSQGTVDLTNVEFVQFDDMTLNVDEGTLSEELELIPGGRGSCRFSAPQSGGS